MSRLKIMEAFSRVTMSFTIIVSLLTALIMPSAVSMAAVNPLSKEINSEAEQGEDIENGVDWIVLEVNSAEKLYEIAKKAALDSWSQDKYVKLTEDIDLSQSDFEYFATFGGVLDGNGHTITGLDIQSDMSYLGFVSKLQPGGIVKNLNVEGTIIPGNKQLVTGGIVGDNYGHIENCTFNGIVKGNDYTGGIAGYNETTGVILNCRTTGSVTGQHYTGGIAGTNAGVIAGSTNQAKINTTNVDKGLSLEDINLSSYLSGIRNLSGDTSESKQLDTANNTIDTGGIVGYSFGIVEKCSNVGDVGYERVGYNVGGIAGRQSGYINGCNNKGTVMGRKDVGGITGQAEPYVQLDLTEDIISQLTDNINELHDLVGKTLDDSGSSSNTISNRLTLVQKFVDDALTDTSYLSDETIDFINGMTSAGNETLNRVDYAIDEASKDGGAIDKTSAAIDDISMAVDELEKVAGDTDIYAYMTPEEKTRYDAAKGRIEENTKEYNGYYEEVYQNNYNFFLNNLSNTTDLAKQYYGMGSNPNRQLVAYNDEDQEAAFPMAANDTADKTIAYIKHRDDSTFPDASSEENAKVDEELVKDATKEAENKSKTYADTRYLASGHTKGFDTEVKDDAKIMTDIFTNHQGQMADDTRRDMEAALKNLNSAADNASSAAAQTSAIADNLSGRNDITLPTLSDGYRYRTNSFVANMQGMAENLGYLNQEMSISSSSMIADMSQVNDSFNKVMILFADALDGALDGEYIDRFEDESFEVANECTDGTIANCVNIGTITGDLDIAGIAGTMGIEYDFDLEGDVTGNSDAKINSTFKTKCVLRANRNEGRITSQKSYCGGMTGFQEMGTILYCENYGTITSSTGDYAGGIAGNSVSSILGCFAKGIISGDEYVGGIAGYGHQIYDSYTIPSITAANSFMGAIAGEVDDDSRLKSNFFVSDDCAGIDRISYSGMAEPLEYKDLLKVEGIPADFKLMKITFLVNDKVIGTKTIEYGKSLDESQFPDPIQEKDYYIDWDTTILHDVKKDMEIVGEPALYRTTIASKLLRNNNQSIVLVDGKFKSSQELEVKEYSELDADKRLGSFLERFEVQVPMDGQSIHQFRLQLPEGIRKASIYVKVHDDYERADVSTMGMYKLFDVDGSKVSIVIIDETTPIWIYVLIISIVVIAAIIAIGLWGRKRPRKATGKDKGAQQPT